MGEIVDYFKNRKNLVSLLILGILILGIPLGINLLRTQQIIKSRAAADPVVFTGTNVTHKSDGSWVTKIATVSVALTSPLGPAGTYNCNSTYTVYPAAPSRNVDIKIDVSSDSPNYYCPVLFQDNKAISTSACTGDQQGFHCTIKSGAAGNHILQLKFGQTTAYPGTNCNQPVICSPAAYQASQ